VKPAPFAPFLLLLAPCCTDTRPPLVALPPPMVYAPVTHGVAAGDVTSTSAAIWARSDRYSALHASLLGAGTERHAQTWVSEAHDYAGTIVFENLVPNTEYSYSAWFASDERWNVPAPTLSASGRFRTAPERSEPRPITFGFSGDLGGIDVCRDKIEGYPIFRTIDAGALEFFVGLGDMIYADLKCEVKGLYGNDQVPAPVAESATLRDYWAHWRYNREDDGLRRLLATTAYYAVWDDHEVVNDFGPGRAWRSYAPYVLGASLIPLGRQALFDENPIGPNPSAPERLYRSFRWGKHLELVALDTRSYRDSNELADSDEHPKTMLGAEQRAWFEDLVTRSDATWKVVISSVPISIPTGPGGYVGRDSWASGADDLGFERELASIFARFRDAGTKRLLFITTDVHFATGFTYRPFPDSPDFVVQELVAGPLNAGLGQNRDPDETFHPARLFVHTPETGPNTFAEAKEFMNWIRVAIDGDGRLSYSVRNAFGREVNAGELP
jgi:alkaline phosphatase D